MRSISPYVTLLLMLAAALAILIGGERLARREEHVRVVADRAPLNSVEGEIERELGRLERLYESHLRQLIRETGPLALDSQSVWRQCDGIVGVSQWSLVHENPKAAPDIHVVVDGKHSPPWPEPALMIDRERLPGAQLLLSGDELLKSQRESEPWGWIDEPGKPLFFWQRTQTNAAVVLLIDPEPLRTVLYRWFEGWAADGFGPARAAGEPAALLGPVGNTIARAGVKPGNAPDFVLPLRSLFGSFQLVSWDRLETRVHYDAPTQTAAGTLSVFVLLLGVLGFAQQRRMLALAAQRVSFVNRVSHELRSPLTNILLNLDLAGEAAAESAPEAKHRLGFVREEANRLGRLIDNVLTFSRKERGRMRRASRPCVPASVIQAVLEQFAPSFARRKIAVCCTGDASSLCLLDSDALAQILANLLSNVEKYVPGGSVEIEAQTANGIFKMTVSDDGPGIPPREASRIFKPFERLNSGVDEGASGTGLGLAIARDLAEAAGGSLDLIPTPRGARFELRAPAPAQPRSSP